MSGKFVHNISIERSLMAIFLSILLILAFVVFITSRDFIPDRLTFILSTNCRENAENEKTNIPENSFLVVYRSGDHERGLVQFKEVPLHTLIPHYP